MWWPTHARAPLATQNVFFSSAPQASSGRRAGTGSAMLGGHVARASGAARRRARRDAHDRVVGARVDRAVVEQEEVGDRRRGAPARRRRGRRSARRTTLPLVITSGRAGVGEQQVVQRRVGQHHAELARRPARPAAATARSGARGASTIGRARRRQQRLVVRAELDERARRRRASARHQRERLVLAVLARAQRARRRLVVGAAGEVEAAEALDRDDRRRAQQRPRGARRRASRCTRRVGAAQRTRGPHAGQALGWAWKRRSAGSSYSARQAAHIAKPGHRRAAAGRRGRRARS